MNDQLTGREKIFFWSFLLFIVGVCTFSANESTLPLFYFAAIVFAGCSLVHLSAAKWKLKYNTAFIQFLIFVFILITSYFWQVTTQVYKQVTITVIQILLFSIFTMQWINSYKIGILAIKAIVLGNVFNCVYRLLSGGLQQVVGNSTFEKALIVGDNDLAMIMVISFSMALFLYNDTKKKQYIIISALFVIIGLTTASRKAVIGLLVVFCVQQLLTRKKLFRNVLIFITIIIISYLVFTRLELFSYSFERITNLIAFSKGSTTVVDHSSQIREQMRITGFAAFKENPIIGYGVGYSTVYMPFGAYLHNNYIELGVSLGIIGIISFYAPHISVIIRSLKIRDEISLRTTVLSIIAVMLIMDYGAVTYFNKFYYLCLMLLCCMVDNKMKEGNIRNGIQGGK